MVSRIKTTGSTTLGARFVAATHQAAIKKKNEKGQGASFTQDVSTQDVLTCVMFEDSCKCRFVDLDVEKFNSMTFCFIFHCTFIAKSIVGSS